MNSKGKAVNNEQEDRIPFLPGQRRTGQTRRIGEATSRTQKAIANFIGQNYSPIGTTSQKCYKTTAELVYELSNIVDVAPMALAKQLADAGYHVEYLAGQPYWVMYERA